MLMALDQKAGLCVSGVVFFCFVVTHIRGSWTHSVIKGDTCHLPPLAPFSPLPTLPLLPPPAHSTGHKARVGHITRSKAEESKKADANATHASHHNTVDVRLCFRLSVHAQLSVMSSCSDPGPECIRSLTVWTLHLLCAENTHGNIFHPLSLVVFACS